MSVKIWNSPIHSTAKISYPYGVKDSGYSCGFHTGVDIVPHGATPNLPDLYSISNGNVVQVNTNPNKALGLFVVVQDFEGNFFRYCHLSRIDVGVGQGIDQNTRIGVMGATGNVTGRHLHLERSTTLAWQCSTFLNPCDYLKIPNVDNTVIEWEGTKPPDPPIPPEPPTAEIEKKKFPWFIFYGRNR